MHSFREMIEIMEREKPLDENWKKWALAGALTAGALAGGNSMMRHASRDRPAETETEKRPHENDYVWRMVSKHEGIYAAELNLKQRQKEYQRKIELSVQKNDKAQ